MNSTSTEGHAPSRRRTALPAGVLSMLFRSLGVLAVLSVPVVSGLASVDAGTPDTGPDRDRSSVWQPAYSEEFPGCVPRALWPADERPAALLTRGPDGRVQKVTVDTYQRWAGSLAARRAIGACR